MENAETVWRPDAPFRRYKKTDEEVRREGYDSGLKWLARWEHIPGGPWVPREPSKHCNHPDWLEHCELLARHNAIWLQGWREGFAQAAKDRPEIRKLRDKLILKRLITE